MNRDARLRIQDRVLILGIVIQVLLLVSQVFTVTILAQQSFQASMIPTGSGEDLQIHIETDTGRPKGILDHITKYLQRQPWVTSSWLGAWFVGGVERTEATVAISITITGSNVASTATVDYWVEGRPSVGGQAHRFIQGTGKSVTVGGAALENSSNLGIPAHLQAMGLSTTESHTIDYYVYVVAEATGAVSGETLTNEIPETKFDTKTYSYVAPATWSTVMVSKTVGFLGYARHDTQAVTKPTSLDSSNVVFGQRTDGRSYSCWLSFPGTGVPKDATIHEARVQFYHDGSGNGVQRVVVTAYDSTVWDSSYVDNYAEWTTRWNGRVAASVTWWAPYFYTGYKYNTTDIKTVIQALVNKATWTENSRVTIFVANDGDTRADFKSAKGWGWVGQSSYLYIKWSAYSASWYPLPPLSLASLPITLDVVAWAALIAATALAWRENRRKMK